MSFVLAVSGGQLHGGGSGVTESTYGDPATRTTCHGTDRFSVVGSRVP